MLSCAGERWDVVLTADQAPGLYWVSVIGEVECAGLNQAAILSYKEVVEDPLLPANETITLNSTLTNSTLVEEEILDFSEDTDMPEGAPLLEDKSEMVGMKKETLTWISSNFEFFRITLINKIELTRVQDI